MQISAGRDSLKKFPSESHPKQLVRGLLACGISITYLASGLHKTHLIDKIHYISRSILESSNEREIAANSLRFIISKYDHFGFHTLDNSEHYQESFDTGMHKLALHCRPHQYWKPPQLWWSLWRILCRHFQQSQCVTRQLSYNQISR